MWYLYFTITPGLSWNLTNTSPQKRKETTYTLPFFAYHSGWQKLLQVMKGSRRFPLTQVSSTHMWSFETIFKKMCVRYLTYQLSKNKNAPKFSYEMVFHQL